MSPYFNSKDTLARSSGFGGYNNNLKIQEDKSADVF